MNALNPKRAPIQQIPVECFEVSNIEDDTMALGNGPFITGVGSDQIEQSIASAPSVRQSLQELMGSSDALLCSNHSDSGSESRTYYGQARILQTPRFRLPRATCLDDGYRSTVATVDHFISSEKFHIGEGL